MRTLGISASDVVLTGGGSGSATWRQAVADICNVPVTILHQDEGAAFGAALQALGMVESCDPCDLQQLVDAHLTRNEAMSYEPNDAAVKLYEEAYQRYQQALNALTPLYS
jgi:xylulokinase